MGKSRFYWYASVRNLILNYERLKKEKSKQSRAYVTAIDRSLEETKKLENGDLRYIAVKSIFFDKTRTVEGVALEVNYSWRTVQIWINDFVKLVGRNVGF